MQSKKSLQTELRQRAEKKSLKGPALSVDELKSMSLDEIAENMHELNVYQIELEMQNEELYKTQEELYDAKMRYFELYDMAPVGYLSLSSEGLILETNLASAEILATPRKKLNNQALSDFIYSEDQNIYYMFRKTIANSKKRQSCELRMRNSEGKVFWTQITASSKNKGSEYSSCKLIFSDISDSRELQAIKEHNEMLHNLSRNILQAREHERKSIAREVHDQLGQLMSALKIDLTWLKRRIPIDSQELMVKVNTMLETINLGIKSVRDIVLQLRPLILDDLGLEAAMEWHAQKIPQICKYKMQYKFQSERITI